jgi:hypothetical protein
MDHETATRIQAAERYVLEEFSAEEKAEFEDHFFECTECADEVRSASILAANARQVLQEERARESSAWEGGRGRRSGRFWWPLLASAALNLALLAGFGLERLHSSVPQAAVEPQFYHTFGVPAASRGSVQSIPVRVGSQFFGARFDLTPGQHFDSFEYQILDSSGASKSNRWLKAPPDEGSDLELAVPVSSLAPGDYVLLLRGRQQSNTAEISRAHFSVQR